VSLPTRTTAISADLCLIDLSLCAKDDPAEFTIAYDKGLPHVARVDLQSAAPTTEK
jgi:hypothetical protein